MCKRISVSVITKTDIRILKDYLIEFYNNHNGTIHVIIGDNTQVHCTVQSGMKYITSSNKIIHNVTKTYDKIKIIKSLKKSINLFK